MEIAIATIIATNNAHWIRRVGCQPVASDHAEPTATAAATTAHANPPAFTAAASAMRPRVANDHDVVIPQPGQRTPNRANEEQAGNPS